MTFKRLVSFVLCMTILSANVFAEKKCLAITLDDLPFVGPGKKTYLNRIIDTIIQNNIPVTGFVIAGKVKGSDWPLLHKFQNAGLSLGNHTFSHPSLDKLDTGAYIREIDAADTLLAPVLGSPKFFRYPYLAMSKGKKRQTILAHLSRKHYQIAPITIDSRDYMFNQLLAAVPEKNRAAFYQLLKPSYLDFIRQQTLVAERNHAANQAQILLIHANLLNALSLQDLIQFYKDNGYAFISLEEALQRHKPLKMAPVKKMPRLSRLDRWVEWD